MALDLTKLKPRRISRNLKGKYILLYGPPKIGKTSLAAQFPKSIMFAFEPGYNALVEQVVVDIDKWTTFREALAGLEYEEVKEMYHTVVIDTADIAWDYCERYICLQNPNPETGAIPKSLGDIPYGKGYDLCKKEYDSCFRRIAMMGYGMVFISHEQEKTVKDENGDEFIKFMPTLPNRPQLIVNRFVDVIAYLRTVQDEAGNEKRMMFFRDCKVFKAGSRFKYMPSKAELSYQGLVDALYEAIDKEVRERGSTTTEELVTPYKEDPNSRSFEDAMSEAKELWTTLTTKDTANVQAIGDVIEEHFGKRIKLSEATPQQLELLEAVISGMKNLL